MSKPKTWAIVTTLLATALLAAACGGGDTGRIKDAELEVGDNAPDFRLPDHTGGYISLSDFLGQKNVVLASYPQAWTPV